jgi:hypothetical protein
VITVESRRRSAANLRAAHPGAEIVDVTSKGPEPWVRFSPFYPHGGIPVPFTPGRTAASVEGVWQALKVFERADVDPARLDVTSMKGIKRSVRTNGPVRGHRRGLDGDDLLSYRDARRLIYLPAYRWVLEHRLAALVEQVRKLAGEPGGVVLLDYTTNDDIDDLSTPLSHAGLVRRWVEDAWPAV